MTKEITNVAASVRQRLLNLARERREDFVLVLTRYGLERVLFRIAQSKYRKLFVLKGALLFEFWTGQRYRPTRDADFLAFGNNSPERFTAIFRQLCNAKVQDDGLHFDPTTVTCERITEDADYHGIRIKFVGYLENARIPIQIDLGFGDSTTPAPIEIEIPSLLNLPTGRLLTYPRESVIAEKLEAIVFLGVPNSRMKDLHDIRSLSRGFSFDGALLSQAIKKTFATRGTELPADSPKVFTAEFFDDANKKKQWAAFCSKNKSYVEEASLESVCREIAALLMPVLEALNSKGPLPQNWSAGAWKS